MSEDCVYTVCYRRVIPLVIICGCLSIAISNLVLYVYIFFDNVNPNNRYAGFVAILAYVLTPLIIAMVVYCFIALFKPALKVCEDGLYFSQMLCFDRFDSVFNLGYGFVGWDNVDLLIIDEPVPGVSSYDGIEEFTFGSCIGVVVKDVDRVCGSKRMRRRARREFAKSGKHFACWVSHLELEDVYQGCKVLREIATNSRFNFDVYDSRKEIPYRKVWGAFTPNCQIEDYHNSRQTVLENGKFIAGRQRISAGLIAALLSVVFLNVGGGLTMLDFVRYGIPVGLIGNGIAAILTLLAMFFKIQGFKQIEKAAIKYGYIPIYFPNTTLPKLQ